MLYTSLGDQCGAHIRYMSSGCLNYNSKHITIKQNEYEQD